MEALDPAVVVPSHGEIGGVELVRDVRSYLEDMRSRVRDAAAGGRSAEEVKAALEPEIRSSYPSWEATEWIPLAVDCFYAELDG